MPVKYHCALDENNELWSIKNVTKEAYASHQFRCLNCGEPMIAVLGEKRSCHFRHKVEHPCNNETYLHQLAKRMFKKHFDEAGSFLVYYFAKCNCDLFDNCPSGLKNDTCFSITKQPIDLKEIYNECVLEVKDPETGKVPDILLRRIDDQKPLWVEIYVTHPCTDDKIDIGNPIVEIKIESEEEAMQLGCQETQLQEISSDAFSMSELEDNLTETNSSITCKAVTLYNFHKRSSKERVKLVREFDNSPRYYATLRSNGIIQYDKLSCRCNVPDLAGDEIASVIYEEFSNRQAYFHAMRLFASNGIGNFKSCLWCKYSAQNGYSPLICKLYKKYNTPQHPDNKEAYYCNYYFPAPFGNEATIRIRENQDLGKLQTKMKEVPKSPPRPKYDVVNPEKNIQVVINDFDDYEVPTSTDHYPNSHTSILNNSGLRETEQSFLTASQSDLPINQNK